MSPAVLNAGKAVALIPWDHALMTFYELRFGSTDSAFGVKSSKSVVMTECGFQSPDQPDRTSKKLEHHRCHGRRG